MKFLLFLFGLVLVQGFPDPDPLATASEDKAGSKKTLEKAEEKKVGSKGRFGIVQQTPFGQSITELGPHGYQQVNQGPGGQTILTARTEEIPQEGDAVLVGNSDEELRQLNNVGQGSQGQGIYQPGIGWVRQGPRGQEIYRPGVGWVNQNQMGQSVATPYGYANQGPGGQGIVRPGQVVGQGPAGQNVYNLGPREASAEPLEEEIPKEEVPEPELRQGLVGQGPGGQGIYGPGGSANQGPGGQGIYGPGGSVNQGPGGQVVWRPGVGYVAQGPGGQGVAGPYGYVGQSGQGQTVRPYYRILLEVPEKLERQYIGSYGPYGGGSVSQGPGGQLITANRPWGSTVVGQGPGGQSIGVYRPYRGAVDLTNLKEKINALIDSSAKAGLAGVDVALPSKQESEPRDVRQLAVGQGPQGQNVRGPYGVVGQGPYGQRVATPYGWSNQGPQGQGVVGPYGASGQGGQGQKILTYRALDLSNLKKKIGDLIDSSTTSGVDAALSKTGRQTLVGQGPGGQNVAGPYGVVGQGPYGQGISSPYGSASQGSQGQRINSYRGLDLSNLKKKIGDLIDSSATAGVDSALKPTRQVLTNQGPTGQRVQGPFSTVGQNAGGQTIGGYRALDKLKDKIGAAVDAHVNAGVDAALPKEEKKKARQYMTSQGPGGQSVLGPYGGVNQGAYGQRVYREMEFPYYGELVDLEDEMTY